MNHQQEAQEIYNKCYMIIMQHGEGLAEEVIISSLAKRFAHEIIMTILKAPHDNFRVWMEIDKCLDNVK